MDTYNIKSAVTGLVVGDALGVPFEFKSKRELLENPCTGMVGYGTWNQPKGTWSDDTSMTLATMDSVIRNNGEINYEGIMQNFTRWLVNDEFTQYNNTFDVGSTTLRAIENYILTGDALHCGFSDEYSNGNGSLMRILPLGFMGLDFETVSMVSSLTHAHERCQIACNFYVEIVKQLLNGDYATFCDCVDNASSIIQDYYKGSSELVHFQNIFSKDYSNVKSSGYVINTLESALYCMRVGDGYKDTLLKAVNLGGDTDTVGAVCGGLAGLYYGFDDIPVEWVECIPKLDYVFDLSDKFYNCII